MRHDAINASWQRLSIRFRAAAFLLLTAVVMTINGSAQDVPKWSLFEETVNNSRTYNNPFSNVTLDVEYVSPSGKKTAFWGFYDGGTIWKFRFMPNELGQWSYSATFSDGRPGKSGTFRCVSSDIPGMVFKDESNPMWIGYKGGGHFVFRGLQVGDRFFASNWSSSNRKAFLDWAEQQGYNNLSIASHYLNRNTDGRGKGWDTPNLWNSSTQRPRPEEYQKMEAILEDLANRRITVYPFAGFFGQNSNHPIDPTLQRLYIRYTIARIGAYWHVLFNIGGPELVLKRWMTLDEVKRLGREIAANDPFGHLLSAHNREGSDQYKNETFSSYGILQGPKTTDLAKLSSGLLANHHPSKPLYAQETLWAGNIYHPAYTDAQLRKNAYVIMMSATALNFADNDGTSSSGFSGTLDLNIRKQSKHDIIRKVWDFMETIPFYRMSPNQGIVNNGYCLARSGERYLVYLPSRGIVDVAVNNGPYDVTWINAQNTSDRRDGGTTQYGQDLVSPQSGTDWLLYLTKTDQQPDPDPQPKGMMWESRIQNNIDDAEQHEGSAIYLTSSDLELTTDKRGLQRVGMCWDGVDVPQGVKITKAYIEMVAKTSLAGATTNLQIQGHDVDDAPSLLEQDIYSRWDESTNAKVVWNNISPWETDKSYQTPDLSPIIQEIVDRRGWQSGNRVMIFMYDASGLRKAWSRDGGGEGRSPLLHIEYEEMGDGTTAFVMENNEIVIEAEHASSSSAANTGQEWLVIDEINASGGSTGNAIQALENKGDATSVPGLASCRTDYLMDIPEGSATKFYFHLRARGANGVDDSVFASIDGNTSVYQKIYLPQGDTVGAWITPGRFTLSPGIHTLTLWMREDGAIVDKMVLNASGVRPTGIGPAESPQIQSSLK